MRTRETEPKICRYQRLGSRSLDRCRRDAADTDVNDDR